MRYPVVWCALALALAGTAGAQEIEMQAELTQGIGTDVSRKGDAVSARVTSPAALQGDTLQGKVTQSKAGGKLGGKAVLSFTFETLQHGGQAVPISAQIRSLANSKGQTNLDEEGRAVRGSSGNLAKAAAGTGLGGLIGGLAGGGRGAAVGAVAGAAASIILIEVAADGPNVRFGPGSRVNLSAKSRGGPNLASLTPHADAAPAAVAVSAPAPTQPAAQPAAAPAATGGQPDLTAVKADFIPGEKTILYDDFSDMAGDEPPPHWKVRGSAAELKVGPGIRQLTLKGENVVLTPNLTGLPKNFTMETDLVIEAGDPDCRPELTWAFVDKEGRDALVLKTKQESAATEWSLNMRAGEDTLGEATIKVNWAQPVKVGLWIQNGRMRFYVNGQRLFDANQVNLPELATMQERMWTGVKSVGFRFVRFAESTPDFSQVIAASGRYVSHGILFDTDSDRLKPESAAVVKAVARGLDTNPNLRLRIEGHTDSVGNADHNVSLSQRRAEAVKAVLVSQFGVDAGRLSTAGVGAGKPIDSNDTPRGRAQNRRVEFVRQ